MSEFDEVVLPEESLSGPDLTEEMRFGSACRALIESEGYQRVRGQMEQTVWEAFRGTPLRDHEGLVYLRVMQKCLSDMHDLLTDAAVTGKLASTQLTAMQLAATTDQDTGGI
jgi:hypothetical protein